MPICTFEGGALSATDLHPVSLSLGEARHRRGRPRLADGEEAPRIMSRFTALSAAFGTEVAVAGNGARVRLQPRE